MLRDSTTASLLEWTGATFDSIKTAKYLYVTAMGWPDNGQLTIKSLAKGNKNIRKNISSVYLLGYGKLKTHQTAEGLVVSLPKPCNKIAPVLRIDK